MEWESLFDGKTLDGWGITGNPESWMVEDRCIVCKGEKGGYLYTLDDSFQNLEMSLEFKHVEKANSGVFFRWTDLKDPVQTGMEIQILDTYGREPPTSHCCGALYDIQPPTRNTCKPAGEWNVMVLKGDGPNVTVELNAEKIVEVDLSRWTTPGKNPDGSDNKFEKAYCEMVEAGHLGLQDHGGHVWFREVKVRRR